MPEQHSSISGTGNSLLPRARYWIGNVVRFASSPWLQSTIKPEIATSIFGCNFGDSGWHHLRRTFEEYDNDPRKLVETTPLWEFLHSFCPQSISSLAGVKEEEPLPLFVFPWVDLNQLSGSAKDPKQSRFCGPSDRAFIVEEYHRTIRLYKKIKAEGYKPYSYPNSFISGTWLVATNEEKRFVVMQGNHRMAALAHLRHTGIRVRASRHIVPFVMERNLERWPQVENGRCSVEHARKVFRFFFEQGGKHVADCFAQIAESH